MSDQTKTLLDTALALPEAERALLVEQLLESLALEPEEMSDEAFLAELERRRAELEKGPSRGIPWSEVKREDWARPS